MPQCGIEPGENAEAAALRELGEETGIAPDKVTLVATAPDELRYDLPDDLIGKLWEGRWRGQRQRWFLYRFTRSEEHTSELQSLMRISYAVFCLKKKKKT